MLIIIIIIIIIILIIIIIIIIIITDFLLSGPIKLRVCALYTVENCAQETDHIVCIYLFIYLHFQISPWIKNAKQVIILTCSHTSGYHISKYQNDSPDTFLKALKTDNFNSPILSELLEQPNTVKGIPAGGW
jgi:hypothetical protein